MVHELQLDVETSWQSGQKRGQSFAVGFPRGEIFEHGNRIVADSPGKPGTPVFIKASGGISVPRVDKMRAKYYLRAHVVVSASGACASDSLEVSSGW